MRMLTAKQIRQVQDFNDDMDYIQRNGAAAFIEYCERKDKKEQVQRLTVYPNKEE